MGVLGLGEGRAWPPLKLWGHNQEQNYHTLSPRSNAQGSVKRLPAGQGGFNIENEQHWCGAGQSLGT